MKRETSNNVIKLIIVVLLVVIIILSIYDFYKERNASNFIATLGAIVTLLLHEKWPFLKKVQPKNEPVSSNEDIHDKKIILDIYKLIPLEDTKHYLESAHLSGAPEAFLKNLDKIESSYLSVEKKIYNSHVELKKCAFINAVKEFNIEALHFLGKQENPNGTMCLPPYHWKSYKGESEERYYSLQAKVREAAYKAVYKYTEFVTAVHDSKILLVSD